MLFAEREAPVKVIENTRVREQWRMHSSRYETLVVPLGNLTTEIGLRCSYC
jgi:hypothetical protein